MIGFTGDHAIDELPRRVSCDIGMDASAGSGGWTVAYGHTFGGYEGYAGPQFVDGETYTSSFSF